MKISFTDRVDLFEPEDVSGFFRDWGHPPGPEHILTALRGSDRAIVAMDGERVVGFVTALTDTRQGAFIQLLEVLPEYRKHGIGSELMTRMFEALDGVDAIDLVCDPELVPFYERFGMTHMDAMSIRRYAST